MSSAFAAARAIAVLREAGAAIDYEAALAANYARLLRPGDVAVDVGAHAGRHLSRFLDLVGPTGAVIGFEPLPFMFDHLRGAFGSARNLTLHRCALSDEDGEARFTVAVDAPEESGLRRRTYNAPNVRTEVITVPVARVDAILAGVPAARFMKVDVEGAELKLLEGARGFLARTRPFLAVEYGRPAYSAYGGQRGDLFAFADSAGFLCADLYGNVIETAAEWDRVCDWVYWDFLLLPREKRDEFAALFPRFDT